jgi:hypothetical protein
VEAGEVAVQASSSFTSQATNAGKEPATPPRRCFTFIPCTAGSVAAETHENIQ